MDEHFAIITDKIRKKYIVLRTTFIDSIENIMLRQDKNTYSLQIFTSEYKNRIERFEYIKYLRSRGYKYKRNLLPNFLFYKR